MRTGRSATAILALAAGLALSLLGCSATTPAAAPTAAAPTTAAIATVTAIPGIPTPAATAANPIADGTYVSGPIAVADVVARIKADTTLSAAQRATYLQEFSGLKTDIVELDFHAGRFTESDALDGAPRQVGARATYAFPDSHTLVIQEDCCGLSTFTITTQPNGFSLMYKAGSPNAGEDVVGEWLYQTSPFTLVP